MYLHNSVKIVIYNLCFLTSNDPLNYLYKYIFIYACNYINCLDNVRYI